MRTPFDMSVFFVIFIASCSVFIETVQGLHCHVCSSDKLELCSTFNSLDELPTELCPTDVKTCYTKIENGITIRGCLNQKANQCKDTCSFCKRNNCNSEIFPEDRLSCLHCEGSSCVNQTNTVDVRYPCAKYSTDDQCFSVFSYDGSVAYRGCMSDDSIGKEYCMQKYPQCSTCSKRACNTQSLQFEAKLSCVKCNPDENSNCNVIDDDVAATECAPTTLGYANECYTYQNGSVSHRGCLYEAPSYIYGQCSNVYSKSCSTCNQTDCNRTPIVNPHLDLNPFQLSDEEYEDPSTERYCYKCNSKVDPNCESKLDDSMIALCTSAEEDLGCYHMITDMGVSRGCVVDLEKPSKAKCTANDDTCKTCFEQSCNRKESFSECLVTDEPYTRASPPHAFDTKASPKICAKYNDTCFTQVLHNETVIRGCVEEYATQNNDLPADFLSQSNTRKYQVCSTPLCNELITANFCLHCNSEDNHDCADNPSINFHKRCPLEITASGCYHFVNETYTKRGCIGHIEQDELRADCLSDSEQCKNCHGNECNDRRSFQRCLWSDHADYIGVSKLCKRYKDSCFIHTSNDIIRRGCVSDLIIEPVAGINIIKDCMNNRVCEKCFADNCNGRFIDRDHCIECSSEQGINCKHAPTEDMKVMCPFTLKGGCYLQQDSGNITRGCAASLSNEVLRDCSSSSNTCKMCHGAACNKKTAFQVCVECSTETDGENCRENTIFTSEKTCPNYMDQCYIKVVNGTVQRGCTDKHTVTKDYCTFYPELCSLCSSFRCNGRIIAPETCIDCDSFSDEKCKSPLVANEENFVKSCPIALNEQGCYHFVDKWNNRHRRGCVTDLPLEAIQYNLKRDDEFKTCKGTKCNSKQTLLQCLVCNSASDPNCATNPKAIVSKTCKNYKNECFTWIRENEVKRGCLNDADEELDVQALLLTVGVKSEVCDTNGCNNRPVSLDTCIECDDSNERCKSRPEEIPGKICDHLQPSQYSGCYHKIVDDTVTRGCMKDLPRVEAIKCSENIETCKVCNGKNCNTRPSFQECYTCNSQNDPQCAKNPRMIGTEICKTYDSSCVTGIDSKGHTHRRCNEQTAQDFLYNFHTCKGSKCNNEIFPRDRLQCYQCNGEKECDLNQKTSTLNAEACVISSKLDQCFTYIGQDRRIFRGCLSDASNPRLLCGLVNEHKNGTCVKCRSDGCNNEPKFKPSNLTCVNCDDDTKCAFGQVPANVTKCENQVTFGDEETCYTHSIRDTKHVKRGCTLDIDPETDWCREEDGCNKCSEPGCNVDNARYRWCVSCHSDTRGNCSVISDLGDYTRQCDNGSPYSYDKRGCFTSVKDGTVTRGCIIDLTDEQYKKCNDEKTCILCTADNCNNEKASGTKTLASAFLCALIVSVTYFL